ncbi:MAG: glycosyl transferase, partial [Actinomycetota bacterium]
NSDTKFNLMRRINSRENVYKANRTHAYQHLAKKFDSHLKVSVGVGAINLIWLAPIAWLVADSRVVPLVGLAIAYAPLILAAYLLQAGKPRLN